MELKDMRAERDRLDAAIRIEEERQRKTWNDSLNELEDELRKTELPDSWSTRKNESICTLRGGGEIRLGYLQEGYGPWLTIESADGYKVEFKELDALDTEKFIRVVRAVTS
jgi:hypothetical protein